MTNNNNNASKNTTAGFKPPIIENGPELEDIEVTLKLKDGTKIEAPSFLITAAYSLDGGERLVVFNMSNIKVDMLSAVILAELGTKHCNDIVNEAIRRLAGKVKDRLIEIKVEEAEKAEKAEKSEKGDKKGG